MEKSWQCRNIESHYLSVWSRKTFWHWKGAGHIISRELLIGWTQDQYRMSHWKILPGPRCDNEKKNLLGHFNSYQWMKWRALTWSSHTPTWHRGLGLSASSHLAASCQTCGHRRSSALSEDPHWCKIADGHVLGALVSQWSGNCRTSQTGRPHS